MRRAMLLALALSAAPLAAQNEVTPAALPCPLDKPYDPSNPFAQVLRGELGRQIVSEDETVMVIIPLSWEFPGHALVIPKRAVRSLLDMTPAEMGHALDVARRVGQAQIEAFGATGFTITQNNARNQTVCHAHFHVVPNSPRAPSAEAAAGERDRIGEKLRAALGGPRLPSEAPPGIPRR